MKNDSQSTRTPVYVWVIALIMMLWMISVVTISQWRMSATFDEQNHVTRGISVLRTGDFRLCFHHPPLANVLEALPVAWLPGTHFDTSMPAWSWNNLSIWDASKRTMWELSQDGANLMRLARIPVLLFTIILALIVFLWSKELFGHWGGLISLGLLALDPNIIAHSGLATTDIPAACTILLAVYLLRNYFLQPTRLRLIYAGIGIGAALATKFSALILVPITGLFLLLMAFLPADRQQGFAFNWSTLPSAERIKRAVGLFVALGVISYLVIWAVYGFNVEPLGMKKGQPLAAHASLIKRIPIPGKQYFRGLITVKHESKGHRAYLLGQTDTTGKGWWYYFPVAFATKTPLPEMIVLLGMLVLIAIPQIRQRLAFHRPDAYFLLLPVGIYVLAALGLLGISLNLGVRHILPIYPFLFILAGGWAALRVNPRIFMPSLVVLGVLQIVSLSLAFPDYLAYFNELAGGTNDGYWILVDSNYDWGQDLGELAKLQKANPHLANIPFSYFGSTPPEAYGVTYQPLAGFGVMRDVPNKPRLDNYTGLIAVSATNLVGGPGYSGVDYTPLLQEQPFARAGKTIFIYNLAPAPHAENASPAREIRH